MAEQMELWQILAALQQRDYATVQQCPSADLCLFLPRLVLAKYADVQFLPCMNQVLIKVVFAQAQRAGSGRRIVGGDIVAAIYC